MRCPTQILSACGSAKWRCQLPPARPVKSPTARCSLRDGSMPAIPRRSSSIPQQALQLHCSHAPRMANTRSCQTLAGAPNIDLTALEMPEIDGSLYSIQEELGATFNEQGVPQTYGNPRQTIAALEAGVVLVDRSHWGRIRVGGEGRMSFLHNQSTNNFMDMKPGEGCDTVFVTAAARTLDLATALVNQTNVLLLVSPEQTESLMARFDKYTFPADRVEIKDVSKHCSMLSLIGPEAENVLKEIAGDTVTVLGEPYGSHQLIGFKGAPLIVVSGCGLAGPGYTLIVDENLGGDLFALLASKGCVLMGEEEWETARILNGRPAVGSELTEEVNPLEAGLYHAVSVNKGCYIGQETLAKVANLDAVKQQLWGLQLHGPVAVGSVIHDKEGVRVGRVTSVTMTPDGKDVGLGFIKCKSGGAQIKVEGMLVSIEGVDATVTAIPFATRTFADVLPATLAGPGADLKIQEAMEAEAAKEVEKEAKAERLRQMQERLASWQAQQGGIPTIPASKSDS